MRSETRDKVETWFEENERQCQDDSRSHHSHRSRRDSHSSRSSRHGSERHGSERHGHDKERHGSEHRSEHRGERSERSERGEHASSSSVISGHSSHRRRRRRTEDGDSRSSHSTHVDPEAQFPVDIKLVAGWLEVIGNIEAAQAAYTHYMEYRRRRTAKKHQRKKNIPSLRQAIKMLKAGRSSSLGQSRDATILGISQLSGSWGSDTDTIRGSVASSHDDTSSRRRRRRRRSSRSDATDSSSVTAVTMTTAITAAEAKGELKQEPKIDKTHLEPKASRRTKYAPRGEAAVSPPSSEHDLTMNWSRVVEELKRTGFNPNAGRIQPRKCRGCCSCSSSIPSVPAILPTVPEDGVRAVTSDPFPRCWSPLIPPQEERKESLITMPQTIRLAAMLKQRTRENWEKTNQAVLEKEDPQAAATASVHGNAWVRERRVRRLLKKTKPTFASAYKRAERAKFWGA